MGRGKSPYWVCGLLTARAPRSANVPRLTHPAPLFATPQSGRPAPLQTHPQQCIHVGHSPCDGIHPTLAALALDGCIHCIVSQPRAVDASLLDCSRRLRPHLASVLRLACLAHALCRRNLPRPLTSRSVFSCHRCYARCARILLAAEAVTGTVTWSHSLLISTSPQALMRSLDVIHDVVMQSILFSSPSPL